MKYRELAKRLTQAGFTPRLGKGDHEVWRNGSVTVAITQTREVSPRFGSQSHESHRGVKTMSQELTITARPWKHGWELWDGDDCLTQCRRLRDARQQVLDYLDTIDPEVDHAGWDITITPIIEGVTDRVTAAQEATARALALTREAAEMTRFAVRGLVAAGVKKTDVAFILGVTKGRVTQLCSE